MQRAWVLFYQSMESMAWGVLLSFSSLAALFLALACLHIAVTAEHKTYHQDSNQDRTSKGLGETPFLRVWSAGPGEVTALSGGLGGPAA